MTGTDDRHASPARRLGTALKALQQRSGRTLRSLESELRISDSSLSRYFRGQTIPPWATVRELCRALGADPDEYRTLWEAADRSQPKQAAPETEQNVSSRTRWWWWTLLRRRANLWARRRWVWVVGGACGGLLCGGLVTAYALWPSEPASGGQASGGQVAGRGLGPSGERQAEGPRIFVNRATGSCLDHSLDQGLRTYAPNGMSYQRWTVRPLPDGGSELRNHATGACLDDHASGLRGASCARVATQRWTVTPHDDASVEVKSRSSGSCLTDGEQGLRATPCDGSDAQRWG
ncbi:helix-turn-helix domain-containing protein [Streptomyces sp. RerS4]|uniref:helix-turn-helix domain-containing protein n=1 Tax=Streptomyces sp. RerS4 TaxID=2942449 RepID=UPI00201C62A6|nr:helix-turn-helix domain-containing protein [Streptomyces sp. RerS4]UQX04575.1 helix-turn-helix domain-containing protein [Streptomyces sp. RerS4]